MKTPLFVPVLILIAIVVAGCASPVAEQPVLAQAVPVEGQSGASALAVSTWGQNTQVDEQGAVVLEITPLNLNAQDNTLEFEVALNTHSVDLGMDLALLATLTTDAGISLNAVKWDAPRGGHHVSGKLIFPSTADGNSVLEGANWIKLQIRNVDAELREFEWNMH